MSWKNFNLQPWIIENLQKNQILSPNEAQNQIIPLIQKNNNLIVSSPTGTGKTYAFLVPIINKVEINKKIQVLIISPTRELAQQTYLFTKQLIGAQPIKIAYFIGGRDIKKDIEIFKKNSPEIVIGTAARIKILYQQHGLNIPTAKFLVLDECDMLFELGFSNDLDFILDKLNSQVQRLAFSATINQDLQIFLKKYFKNVKIVNLNKSITPKIEHIFINSPLTQRNEQLKTLVTLINPYLCIIFVNNKSQIIEIKDLILQLGKKVALIHSDLTARQRLQIFKRIKNLEYQYLIASDVSARGIDIPGISHIISLQLPSELSYYLHRAGRTGRNNQTGISYVFYDHNDLSKLDELKKFNIYIKYYKIKKNELIEQKSIGKTAPAPTTSKAAQQIINRFYANKKIKPGYKKNFKDKITQIKIKERVKKKKNRGK